MRLSPSDPDIQTLINRIKTDEIDLQPEFQRGEVWSLAKKQRLIDSILRDWHIPPIHVIVDSDSGQLLVLDGQQRLAAIRDFTDGMFAVDGKIEPLTNEILNQHGKRYNTLPSDLRRRFDQFTIRVFRITDYAPSEPGELFYRLNQPTALTAAEQRNAFFGETRKQIKGLVAALEDAKLDDGFWGFTNARMAYDDILSRAALFLEQNSLKKKVTSGTLADRFRSGRPFATRAIDSLAHVITLLRDARSAMKEPPKLNKATAQSWLVFLSVASSLLGASLSPDVIGDFISSFETRRFYLVMGLEEIDPPEEKRTTLLFRSYEDRSTSRVSDALSVQTRDFVLWSWFLIQNETLGKEAGRSFPALRRLGFLLKDESAEEWAAVEKLVSSLNWGDPLWE